MTLPCQVPLVMVPTVAMSVPTNLEAAMEPASMVFVTVPVSAVLTIAPFGLN